MNLDDPTSLFAAPLPSIKDSWETYSKGQLADGLGASRGTFQNAYNADAFRNLNMQIGAYNALKATKAHENPQWTPADIDDYMSKTYGADNLFTKYTQMGGGMIEGNPQATDPSTGQAIGLSTFDFMPRGKTVGLGQRLLGMVKDPYTGEWKANNILGISTVGVGAEFTRRQAGKASKLILQDARNANKGGLSKAKWDTKYPNQTKKSVMEQAKKLGYKETTAYKTGKKIGKSKLGAYAAPYAGEVIGEAVGGETGRLIGQTGGTALLVNKVGRPGAVSFAKYLASKAPGIAAKAGVMAMADSPALPIGDLIGLGWSAAEVYRLYKEWTKGQAKG